MSFSEIMFSLLPLCLTRRLAGYFLSHSQLQEIWELPAERARNTKLNGDFSITTGETFEETDHMKDDNSENCLFASTVSQQPTTMWGN